MASPFARERIAPQATERYPIVCAWCKAKERFADSWGPIQSDLADPYLSHGICPDCMRLEQQRLNWPCEAGTRPEPDTQGPVT